tara:strand:- start:1405 stop:1536 length:132 start_codon:yes stop_codon:yes gene_type:complete
MAKATSGNSYIKKPKKRGLAAKTQTSKTKTSKLYKKQYRGQGR